MSIFEQASRAKLRFMSPKGALTVEDLWDLPLTSATGKPNLDAIGVSLMKAVKESSETLSLVNPGTADAGKSEMMLAFNVVKHIIDVRLAESKAASEARAKTETKQKLLEIIAKKQDSELEGKTLDELKAMVSGM